MRRIIDFAVNSNLYFVRFLTTDCAVKNLLTDADRSLIGGLRSCSAAWQRNIRTCSSVRRGANSRILLMSIRLFGRLIPGHRQGGAQTENMIGAEAGIDRLDAPHRSTTR